MVRQSLMTMSMIVANGITLILNSLTALVENMISKNLCYLKQFKIVGADILFGNENAMFFIPCYSDQNGYYTAEIDIYYDGKRVLHFDCEERDY